MATNAVSGTDRSLLQVEPHTAVVSSPLPQGYERSIDHIQNPHLISTRECAKQKLILLEKSWTLSTYFMLKCFNLFI